MIFLFYSCNENKKKFTKVTIDNGKSINIDSILKASGNNNSLDVKKQLLDSIYSKYKYKKNSKGTRDDISKIIYEYFYLSDWKNLNIASDKLYKISDDANDSINLGIALRFKGFYYKSEKVYDSSFYYYLKAEKLYLKVNDKQNYASVLLNKGIVQYNAGDYLGSELTLSQSYAILKNSDDKRRFYDNLNALGNVSDELKDHDKAIGYYNEALKLLYEDKGEDKEHKKSILYNNIGFSYQNRGIHKLAIENFLNGLKDKSLRKDFPELYANLTDNLAYSKLKTKDYSFLPNMFIDALQVRDSLKNNVSIVLSKLHLSEFYYLKNDINKSKMYAKDAYALSLISKAPSAIIMSLKQMSNIDKQNSSIYTNSYIKITDSLQIVERNSKDRFARIQLETDELRQENSFLEEKNRNILNYFFASILIFSLLLYMRTQRSKNRYLIMEQAQQKANEDIYRLIISQQDKLEEGKNLEKSRIAKEIHDGILGRLFGLRLNLDGLNYKSEEEAKEERHLYLSELQLIEQDLREISHELSREKTVLVNNFLAILNRLFEEQIKINKAELVTLVDEKIDWNLLSNTTKINLYRIVQESLQNCNKYSKAKKITVAFQKDVKGNLILTIFDDGIGFEVNSKSKGIGLTNIVDRVHESLGTIDIISAKNKGTAITITVPLEFKTIKI